MKKSLGELFIESEDGVCDVKEQEVAYTWFYFIFTLVAMYWKQHFEFKKVIKRQHDDRIWKLRAMYFPIM
jgi:hypothetical protein